MTTPDEPQSSAEAPECTLEELFDRFFKQRPEAHQEVDRGRLQNLATFEQEHFKDFYQPNVLSDTRRVLNERLSAFGSRVQPPHGPATLHFDFIDSSESNGTSFYLEGKYFLGITSQTLLDFDRASIALTGRGSVRDLLRVPIDPPAMWALISALLTLQIQFIAFHELGHIVHNHTHARTFHKEYRLTPMENLLLLYPDQDAKQANEWMADRHSVRMLMQNLISTEAGVRFKSLIKSELPADECVQWLLLLAIGSAFFFGPSERFHLPLVRKRDHPFDLARLNIIMRSIFEWAEEKNREDIKSWASDTSNFEWATSCIRDSAQNADRANEWRAQGEFLRTKEGRDYLDVIYKEDGVITRAVEESWWKVS